MIAVKYWKKHSKDYLEIAKIIEFLDYEFSRVQANPTRENLLKFGNLYKKLISKFDNLTFGSPFVTSLYDDTCENIINLKDML